MKSLWRQPHSKQVRAADTERFANHVNDWDATNFLELKAPVKITRAREYWRLFYAPITGTSNTVSNP
ncbi:MAG: hypothetical protein CMF19_07590 [Idiomarinaceae bacterium]|nr:hypothetical protein [Idiomarinaceae bacterium]